MSVSDKYFLLDEYFAVASRRRCCLDLTSPHLPYLSISLFTRIEQTGATNRPHELDDAARRRFVKRLYIPLPERPDREILLRTLLKKNVHSLSDEEITKLSSATHGYSGADLKALCNDASMGPIRDLGARAMEVAAEDVPPISYKHFRRSLKGMNPSVSEEDLDDYIKFNDTYGNKHREDNDDDDDDDDSD